MPDKIAGILNEIYFSVVGYPEKDKRHKCWACNKRLSKGKGRIFRFATYVENGIIKRSKGLLYHKYRKDCGNKKSWTKARKEDLKVKRGVR